MMMELPPREVERFWAKVNKQGPIPDYRPDLGPCWIWTGYLTRDGRGRFAVTTKGQAKHHLAYRYAYDLLEQPIPVGLELDHLCRVPACVRPSHLEPVTHRENQNRSPLISYRLRTECRRGHVLTLENTTPTPSGGRSCRDCARERRRRFEQRHAPK